MPWYRVVQLVIMALGILAGAIHIKRISKSGMWLFILLVITFFNEIISWYFSQIEQANYVMSYFFIPIQYICLIIAFSIDLKLLNSYLYSSMVFVILLSIVYICLNLNILNEIYPSLLRTCANVFIIIVSLLWFREFLRSAQTHSFTEYVMFWMSLGWLLFVVITLINFSAFNYLVNNAHGAKLLFRYIRIYANFMLYTLFIFSFLCKQRQLRIN